MLRRLALAAVLASLFALPARAQLAGFGVQGGLFTPTNSAKNLINSEWQLGLRLLLPPVTPIGTLNIGGLNLDVGVDLGVGAAKQLSSTNLNTQMVNVTAVYRYTFPIGQSTLMYLGLGGRMTTAWGELTKEYAKGSLWGHLRGEMSAAGGLDYVVAPSTLLDLKMSYGLFGFTSWEATLGLLFAT